MRLTLFSVDEANQLAQELRPLLERLARAKQEFHRLQGRVDVLTLAAAGASPSNPDARELRLLVQRRDRLAERLRLGVQAILERGAVVKDLDRGLVDFYSIIGDRLIFLCWHLGESEVAHWHTLDGGFAGRRPLDRAERG